MPERALRLNGPSLEIVERCDGQHTVQQIILDLQKIYSKAEPQKVDFCKKNARSTSSPRTQLRRSSTMEFVEAQHAAPHLG